MFKKVILSLSLVTIALVSIGTAASAAELVATEAIAPVQETTTMNSANSISWWWE